MEKNSLVVSIAVAHIVSLVREAYGLTVAEGSDMKLLDRIVETVPGKRQTPQSIKENFDRTPVDWIWLCAFDQQGQCISTQVARLDRLGSMSLGHFIAEQHWRLHVSNTSSNAKLGHRHSSETYKIFGNVSYQMEMYVANDAGRGRYRDGILGGYLASLFQLMIYSRWAPDCTYCFMSKELVRDGFAARSHFNHWQPNAVSWDIAPRDVNAEDYLVYNRSEDLHNLAGDILGKERLRLVSIPERLV